MLNIDISPLPNWFLSVPLYLIVVIGFFAIMIGFSLVSEAHAVNSTDITLTLDELRPNANLEYTPYHVFFILFLFVALAVFMGLMFRMREQKEISFFSISALIVSLVITIILLSPVSFDIQTEKTVIDVFSNDTAVYEAHVSKTTESMIIIPYDNDLRFVMSSLFTGITLFNGLYTIFILTSFSISKQKQR